MRLASLSKINVKLILCFNKTFDLGLSQHIRTKLNLQLSHEEEKMPFTEIQNRFEFIRSNHQTRRALLCMYLMRWINLPDLHSFKEFSKSITFLHGLFAAALTALLGGDGSTFSATDKSSLLFLLDMGPSTEQLLVGVSLSFDSGLENFCCRGLPVIELDPTETERCIF